MKQRSKTRKKLILISVLSLLVVSSVLGAWIISLQATITGSVTSDEDGVIVWDTIISNLGVTDVSNASTQQIRSGVIQNFNGDLNFTFEANETRLDVVDACTDYLNDVVISYKINNVSVVSSDEITLTSGLNDVDVIYDVIRSACPQNVSVSLNFVEA